MGKIVSREIRLASRPPGMPVPQNFTMASVELGPPRDGELLVRNLFLSVDPYMRGRMREGKSYVPPFEIGKPLEGGAVGGPISILVNNAGISQPQPLDQITERDWDEILAVNLKSMFLVTQAVLPSMRKQRWGRIINLSSVAAQLGGVIGPHYAASKAGCLGLTHSYAALLAKEGITVNAIAPALIETEMITSNPKARADIIPLGRFGTVEETAEVAVMLARNGYITGQTINVNGGWYMS